MSELAPDALAPRLSGTFGRPYLYAIELPSTQDVLRGSDLPHGTVVLAEHQTAGRGRSARSWDDSAGKALLFSVLLRPPLAAPLPQLSLVAGLAVAEAVERETGIATKVKWPNDVLAPGGKVAGILLEASGNSVVCGVGINVNQAETELPEQPRTPATSLALATGSAVDRGLLLTSVLAQFERRYDNWVVGGLEALAEELSARNALSGIRVRTAGREGEAGAIAPDGRLTVKLDRGDQILVESGEIEIVAR